MKQKQKRQRFCKACGQQGYHDNHNCPSKLSSNLSKNHYSFFVYAKCCFFHVVIEV